MKYEIYTDIIISHDFHIYEFKSIGKHGSIFKKVAFDATELPGVYNLSFGDTTGNDKIDNYSVSDNGDRNKILATLVKIIEIYTTKYPERWVYFRGSTKERTRLYRMAIGLNLAELQQKFKIYAEMKDNSVLLPFEKNMPVTGFLIKIKNSTFT